MSITEINLMIQLVCCWSNHCLWKNEGFQRPTALLFLQAAAFSGHPGCLVKTSHILFIIQMGWENIFFFWQSWVAFQGITSFKVHPPIAALKFDTERTTRNLPAPHFPTKTQGLRGWLYLHAASHLGIYQGEVAGCQPLALSQYLITVQLCREKETFHLPITWLLYKKNNSFHYIYRSTVTPFRKLSN